MVCHTGPGAASGRDRSARWRERLLCVRWDPCADGFSPLLANDRPHAARAAAGVAIVRYRLYDIDRIINRTLVYGLLTALLGAVYAGAVLVLGQVFGGIGGDPPSWAVAGATLAVAALFQPARRRIQQASIGASTDAVTTRPRRSRRSAIGCAIRWTWTRSQSSC